MVLLPSGQLGKYAIVGLILFLEFTANGRNIRKNLVQHCN